MHRSLDRMLLPWPFLIVKLSLLFLLAFPPLASPESHVICVINAKPPSVSVIDSETWQLTHTIPTEEKPAQAVLGPEGRFLYLTHNATHRVNKARTPATLSVVDLDRGQVAKTLYLGWGDAVLSMSQDSRYVICFTTGIRINRSKRKPEESHGGVVVLDTGTNEEVFRVALWRIVANIAWTRDVSSVFVFGAREIKQWRGQRGAEFGWAWDHRGLPFELTAIGPHTVTVFDHFKTEPVAEIPVGETTGWLALSSDDKWLYAVGLGTPSENPKKNRTGRVYIAEVETRRLISSHDIGVLSLPLAAASEASPVTFFGHETLKQDRSYIYRLAGPRFLPRVPFQGSALAAVRSEAPPGLWSVSENEVVFLPDGPDLSTSPMALSPRASVPFAPSNLKMEGRPAEALVLAQAKKLAILNRSGQVGIVDMRQKRLQHVVKAGQGGGTSFWGMMAQAAALGVIAGGLSVAAGAPVLIPVVVPMGSPRPRVLGMAGSPDDEVLFVLDTSSANVTAVDTRTGAVRNRVKVGGDCRGLLSAPGWKFQWALSPDDFSLNPTSGDAEPAKHEYGPESGSLRQWAVTQDGRRALLLCKKALQVWDAETAKPAATVKGFSEAQMLVLPQHVTSEADGD